MSSVFEIVWILLLLLKISMASRDVSFENIQPGELTSNVIVEIGNHVPFLKPSLKWFSNNVKLFNFTTKDGLVLQGYFLDHRLSTGVDCTNQRVIVHCAGFTESTLKYAQYLQRLYNLGYSIFSFDLRNQGFSASAGGYSSGSIAHMDSLSNTYVLDLEYFIIKHVHPCSKDIIFSGNSLSALIGLTLQQQNPIFEKIIVYSPCIAPNIPPALHLFIWLANWMGFGSTLAVRLGTDISTEKLTHDIQNLESWKDLRLLIPNYLILAGPTFRWLNELIIASANIIKVASAIKTNILVFQASEDTYVDNTIMNTFFMSIKSPYAKLVRINDTYHELLIENESVVDTIIDEIKVFLSQEITTTSYSKRGMNTYEEKVITTVYVEDATCSIQEKRNT